MNGQQGGQQRVDIKANDETMKGRYANMMQVAHTKEEFALDFMLVTPPAGQLVSRVITSPGHAKRILKALEENLANYEKQFGAIETAEGPSGHIGFQA